VQRNIEEVIAENRVAPDCVLDPESAVQERVILLGGSGDRPDTPEAMQRAEAFFIALQFAAKDYIALKATKTGVVYQLLGNPPSSHE